MISDELRNASWEEVFDMIQHNKITKDEFDAYMYLEQDRTIEFYENEQYHLRNDR